MAVTMHAHNIRQTLRSLANPSIAAHSLRFFKTGPGQYGEGDQFLGIRVPVLRSHLPTFRDAPLAAVLETLRSPWHEERLFALLLMVARFATADQQERDALYQAYLAHTAHINNWDLVDCSAHHIVGATLEQRDRAILRELARSESVWERRIAVIATFHFIRQSSFDDCLEVAELLLADRHDLMHKAVGWMLREVGKRDPEIEEQFLRRHAPRMPRVMLRYAIEKFPESKRKNYLQATMGSTKK
jgi:3-methyladenine DNA glycosylase AlkD